MNATEPLWWHVNIGSDNGIKPLLWASIDPDLFCLMASLGHNDLMFLVHAWDMNCQCCAQHVKSISIRCLSLRSCRGARSMFTILQWLRNLVNFSTPNFKPIWAFWYLISWLQDFWNRMTRHFIWYWNWAPYGWFLVVCNVAVKLPWIFPGVPLTFNGTPGNIQGNLTGTVMATGI